jgi:acyl-coenzyme A synthetase/AMP-(fatty) acid ligase
MPDAGVIGSYHPDDVLAYGKGYSRTARQFLSDVAALLEVLPDRPTVLNLATSRYAFLVGFIAAIVRKQVTLLPQNHASRTLHRIVADYPGSYSLTDSPEFVPGMESVRIPQGCEVPMACDRIPRVPLSQVVAVAFTSGSTGRPKANTKTWEALTSVAHATGARLGIQQRDRMSVVATVPHQHMFGLEASVMLPLMHGLPLYAERPLFPEDIRRSLLDVPAERLLVTTPLHIRACVAANAQLPPLRLILSATAPLPRQLAQAAEQLFRTTIHEIYGFAEAGSVAERRTATTEDWQPLHGVSLVQDQGAWSIETAYHAVPLTCPDRITVHETGMFALHGRNADQVNIAGHSISLYDLNQRLLEIEGVEDGTFFVPDSPHNGLTRLTAFVVAPAKTESDIHEALRMHLHPVFLPRPLFLVPRLPRNELGKLPLESLNAFAHQWLSVRQHGR